MNTVEPDWTAENINRKAGSTTFKSCGWCKHMSCGTVRYGCYLSGNCGLMKNYEDEVQWDTPCKIVQMGATDLKALIGYKKGEIEGHKHSIKSTQEEVGELTKLMKKAKKTPPLPDNRLEDFDVGETIWVFIPKEGTRIPATKWYKGKVILGYRSGDGCVSYVLDDLPESKGGWGCGVSVPCVLKDWEFQYFRKNGKEFGEWLKQCKVKSDKMKPADMLELITKK